MIYAQILAAGLGSRISSKKPKQFLEINDIPVLIYSLKIFLEVDEIDKIYISVSNDFLNYTKELLIKSEINLNKIEVILGGLDRKNTVLKCIEMIKNTSNFNSEDILITHDAARPFIKKEKIVETIMKSSKYDIVSLAITLNDTVTLKSNNKLAFLKRDDLLAIQTPQTFKINKYLEYLSNLNSEQLENVSDITSVFLLNNKNVCFCKGSLDNIKITNDIDLEVAKVISKKYMKVK